MSTSTILYLIDEYMRNENISIYSKQYKNRETKAHYEKSVVILFILLVWIQNYSDGFALMMPLHGNTNV